MKERGPCFVNRGAPYSEKKITQRRRGPGGNAEKSDFTTKVTENTKRALVAKTQRLRSFVASAFALRARRTRAPQDDNVSNDRHGARITH
jgi:hypothetical protein